MGGKPRLDPKVTKSVMLKAGLKPLEPYKSFFTKWKCLHIECGQIVYPTYAAIQRGQGGCRDCGFKIGSTKRKKNKEDLTKVMAKAKLEPLEPYKNSHSKWKCRCLVCKKIVYPSYKYVSKTSKGCRYCSKVLVDEVDAVKSMLKARLKPLEPYKNSKTGWKCKCLVCNKTVFPVYNSIQSGRGGCKYCAGNAVNPADARKLFTKAKLMPLEPYKGADAKWKCKCMKCDEIVYPTYGNVYMGHGGCVYCSDIGFKPQQPALLYLITHLEMDSIKVGITNTKTVISRLDQFKRHGWKIHKKYTFKKGVNASIIEREIIDWLKKDLKLPNHLSPKQMPITGGHSETFNADTISVLEIQKRIDKLVKGYRNNQ
jgi:hypothetical protein